MNELGQREASASIRGIFATPVIECAMPGAEALNAELKQVILEGDTAQQPRRLAIELGYGKLGRCAGQDVD